MELPSTPSSPTIVPHVSSYSRKTFKWAILLSLLMTAGAGALYSFLQPVIPLFYTLTQPDQQLVGKWWIFLFPSFAWLVTMLHFSLLKTMKNLAGSIERIFCWTTVGIIGITTLLFIRLILAIT